jgi:glycine dehydrogenase
MLKNAQKDFIQRHIGPSVDEQNIMLKELGYKNLDELIKDTVPEKILSKDDLEIGDPNSEYKALRKLKKKQSLLQLHRNGVLWNLYTICNT